MLATVQRPDMAGKPVHPDVYVAEAIILNNIILYCLILFKIKSFLKEAS